LSAVVIMKPLRGEHVDERMASANQLPRRAREAVLEVLHQLENASSPTAPVPAGRNRSRRFQQLHLEVSPA